jgi:oligopeptide/dipeptide ABC transporter ATP-binding protein
VMIAIALACDPRLIIADEPTTALDVTIQAQILELMKALTRDRGIALIIITHNLGVVARYADRVNVMYAGRIVESGPAAEIYHDPRHPYTVALLRSVPRLDRPRQARLDPVEGQPPDLTRLDAGCAFRPRCRLADDGCAVARPILTLVGAAGHSAACFKAAA